MNTNVKAALIVLAVLVALYVVLDRLPHAPIRASIGG